MMFKDMIITVSKVSGEILQGAEELQWRLRASLMPASCLVHGFFDLHLVQCHQMKTNALETHVNGLTISTDMSAA